MITFDGVSKVYPDGTVAVDGLDLELPTGELTVFVGPSGCGKTTSLRMINRMVEPTKGRVLIDGKDVATGDAASLRRGIGYVIQAAGLFPHRTIVENIMTVPGLVGTSKKKARSTAVELMERVGLSESMADRYPVQLSGGQQQRVGVARALAADPPVMIMDEPFSAVDPIVREGLQAEFLRLQRDLGKTIAMVTHDIDEAIKMGDRVAVFREGGHLAQFATPRELLSNPADDFVAGFVGRDRGFRSLSFDSAAGLEVEPVSVAQAGPERLVLDDAGRPIGWTGPGLGSETAPTHPGGWYTSTDSLRLVTDLAITSPVGIVIRVDEHGVVDGVIRHTSLMKQLEARRRREVDVA
ncbi:ABC transporter ATP-binding protein [Frigoribacterium sp. CFBP9039]|uniref:ABC transporter ATP-binding protein n=1 Tax=unclassified Frigoribacterium TaxID=2627005 RepID=UPI002A6B14BA|nr:MULTISPECIES: ABC transporter ATP-binding protein [unclassified Frigoribacterium]MDY0893215.1 ABC transporter ATP-binding protein [Frigoribacterium sp. CFBP9030]MDY0946888.1 ABC transporter ATP-binding protein [Frigoribacterium sp. CFBP9039]